MNKAWPYFTIVAASVFLAFFLRAQKQPETHAPGVPGKPGVGFLGWSPGNAARGKTYFQRDCAVCHSVGRGNQIGPDLLGVTRRRTHRWLITMIQHPDQLAQQHDPIALALFKKYAMQMPDLHVSDAECADLIAYFETESAAHEKAAPSK
jgi:mono/diheme cytochrome c family protein